MRGMELEWAGNEDSLKVKRECHDGTDGGRKKNFHALNLTFEGENGVKNGRFCQHMGKTRNIFPGKLF